MLLPNLDQKINKGVKVTTILEKDLTKEMETLLTKLHLDDKKEIINIGWQKSNLEDIKQAVQNNDCIIINGTKEFIEKAREEIENNLLENKIIEIIDCYDIEDCKYGIKDILDKHDKILNTSGEKNKEEYITTIKCLPTFKGLVLTKKIMLNC